jgi:nucleotide-binding universal stress UspA family protein
MTVPGEHRTVTRDHSAQVPLTRIVCGVNGTRMSAVAMEQALELAALGAIVEFVSVTDVRGTGATRMAGTGRSRAQAALDAARRAAAERGIPASMELCHDAQPRRALLERAQETGDVLVVGARPGTRTGGIMIGSTAAFVLHEGDVPVLVARPVPGGRRLAERVMVATTGTGSERHAVRVAAELAALAGGRITLAHCGGHGRSESRHELALEAADAREITGVEPVVVTVPGHGPAPIVAIARELEASLLVLASRGLTGVRAVASVSERVGAAAPCSVLVVREPRA